MRRTQFSSVIGDILSPKYISWPAILIRINCNAIRKQRCRGTRSIVGLGNAKIRLHILRYITLQATMPQYSIMNRTLECDKFADTKSVVFGCRGWSMGEQRYQEKNIIIKFMFHRILSCHKLPPKLTRTKLSLYEDYNMPAYIFARHFFCLCVCVCTCVSFLFGCMFRNRMRIRIGSASSRRSSGSGYFV